MAQITVTFESYEDLKEFAEKLLGTKQETAVQSNAVANKSCGKGSHTSSGSTNSSDHPAAPTVAPVSSRLREHQFSHQLQRCLQQNAHILWMNWQTRQ